MKDNIEEIRKSFTDQAEHFNTERYHLSKAEYTDYMIEKVSPQKTDTVLEVAAGTCICGRALAPYVRHVKCLDATPAMLERGKEEAERAGIVNISFMDGMAEDLPFANESFDLVISRLAFHHFSEPELIFSEMKRVLKTGGKLVIWDMSAAKENLRKINDDIERLRDPSHVRILSRQEIKGLYKNDFEITECDLKYIPVNLKGWMEFTNTPDDIRGRIITYMERDLSGKEKTGFDPYRKEDELCFDHRWILTIGVKK